MNKKLTILTAALALLTILAIPIGMWGQTRDVATLAYSGSTTFNMEENTNYASSLGLNEANWSVIGAKNDASYMPACNKNGTIRLYPGSTNGSSITVTLNGGTITSISFDMAQNTPTVKVGGNTINPTNNEYSINSSSFVVINGIDATSSNQVQINSITINYTPAAPSYNITAVSNNESYGTVSLSGSVITGSPQTGYQYATPAYTVTSGTATVSQSGNSFTVTPSSDCTVQINFEAIPTHTATFSVNGATSTQDFAEGADIVFPADPDDTEGKTFVGWAAAAIDGITQTAPDFVTSATMGNSNVTFYAVFANFTPGSSTTTTDVLTRTTTGIASGAGYSDWSGKTSNSDAVYAGNSAGGNDAIQLRSNNNNSGVVTTASGGKATKVTISWESNTSSDRTLDIYGKNSAYEAATDLYDNNKKGTKLGSVVCGTSTVLNISGDYDFIGMRSNSGAMYISSISIDWSNGTPDTYTNYCTTVPSEDTWSVVYNGNGSDGGEVPIDNNEYSSSNNTVTVLSPGTLTKTGHTFNGWNTVNDGTGTSYAAGNQFTINANTILYAQWTINSYSYDLNVTGADDGAMAELEVDGTTAGSTIQYGKEVEVVVATNDGYSYSISVKDADNNDVTVANDKFTMPASDVTVTVTTTANSTYTLVSSKDQLISGQHYIIAAVKNTTYYAMGKTGTNNRPGVEVTEVNSIITGNNNVCEVVIIGPDAGGFYSLYDVAKNEYLYAASSNSNNLKSQNPNDSNGRWTIEFDEGEANIVAQGSNSRNTMRFNKDGDNAIFSCYGSASTQQPIYLYAKDGETPISYYTTINAYTNNSNGWYLIAPPVGQVTPTTGNYILAPDYDLYYFDQSKTEEWRNYKQGAFNLVSGHGYLYANSNTVTLTFEGMPYVGNGQVFLAYEGTAEFPGYNLIGNPYNASATVNKDFYKMNDEGSEISVNVATGGSVAAMEGIFVVATAADQSVTFTPESQSAPAPSNQLVMNLSRSTRGSAIDRAIVRFEETEQLPKFQLFENSTKLYIPQGGKDYAVVRSEAQGEMPVNFKADKNGTYTLSIDIDADMDYLHLIDNMTGADVDLLQTPSYTFDARTSDYASRFRLMFSINNVPENEDSHSAFAYFNGSEWVINASDNATVQVVDVMGRVILNADAKHGVSTANMPAGVYMLRLVNGNNVKVQKIVVR